jgi:SAM-dependent methyltransferase
VTLYDRIGSSYASTRVADPRIVDHLDMLLALPAGSAVADIGAGTGMYTNALAARGYRMIAVEPSAVMRNQAIAHPNVQWLESSAEGIPLADRSVDGVLSTLAVHHFRDLSEAVKEMIRITCGPVLLFTFDPVLRPDFWLYDYFPLLREEALRQYPSAERIRNELQVHGCESIQVVEFPLPRDLRDRFTAAGWGEPESYLDPEVRANMSPFRLMPEALVEEGVSRLRDVLKSGVWDAKYGHLRSHPELSVGYVFIRADALSAQPRV